MDYQLKVLAVVAAINVLFSIFIARQEKSPTNLLFSLFTLFIGLWSLGLGIFVYLPDASFAVFVADFFYLAPPLIVTIFYYFSIVFVGVKFESKYYLHLVPFFALLATFILNPNFLIDKVYVVDYGILKDVTINKISYLFYATYVVGYIIASYLVLFRAKNTIVLHGKEKQLKIIIFGTLVSYTLASFFNLLLPYLGNYQLISFGPLSTSVMVFSIAYAILKYQLFNIKLILVELAILLLNFFLFINIFLSHGTSSFIFNISLFSGILLFSIFLVRGIYKDIRDREQIFILAKEMEDANEKLRVMEGQKTEFVSIASHQLRTPLTVIKGYASMVLEGTFGNISTDVREAMEKLYKSSERIVSLVEDLLTVSRIEQGRMMLVFATVDFKEFTQKVLEELREEIEESKLELSFTIEDGGDFKVLLDEKKFKQVIAHIIENAVKYTAAPGKIRIFLTEDNVTNKVRLSISDTGVGMTTEQIYAVFERFNMKSNLDAAGMEKESVKQSGGIDVKTEQDLKEEVAESEMMKKRTPGIGLYIAQEIIEAHHGSLHLESAGIDKGTTVIVELPKAIEIEK